MIRCRHSFYIRPLAVEDKIVIHRGARDAFMDMDVVKAEASSVVQEEVAHAALCRTGDHSTDRILKE